MLCCGLLLEVRGHSWCRGLWERPFWNRNLMAKVTLIAISIPLAGAQMQQEQPEPFSEISGVQRELTWTLSVTVLLLTMMDTIWLCVVLKRVGYYYPVAQWLFSHIFLFSPLLWLSLCQLLQESFPKFCCMYCMWKTKILYKFWMD